MDKYVSLNGYLDDAGKFERLPGKRQKNKQNLMLQYLAEKFQRGQNYSEKEVNEILNQHHSFGDPATLRRLMFGRGLLDRTIDGKSYWLTSRRRGQGQS